MENILLTTIPIHQLKSELVAAIRDELTKSTYQTNQINSEEEYLTRAQVATLLSISIGTVAEWTKSGKLIGYRIGRRIRFKKCEVIESLSKIKTR